MASSEVRTEFRVVGEAYEGAGKYILAPSFLQKMTNIVIQEAVMQYGAKGTLVPTNVQLIPAIGIEGDPFFVVQAWHETTTPEGDPAILQQFTGSFELVFGAEDVYIRDRDEPEGLADLEEDPRNHHKLTTIEVLGLISLSNLARAQHAIALPVDQETI